MKAKKWNKTGTGILLALAPAAALVPVAIMVESLVADREVECDSTEWESKYNKMLETYKGTFETYGQNDVTLKINGDVKKSDFSTIYIYDKSEGRTSDIVCFDIPQGVLEEATKLKVAGTGFKYDFDQYISACQSVSYFSSRKSLRIVGTKADNTSREYTLNQYGYLTKEVVTLATGTTTFEIDYNGTPKINTEYELKYQNVWGAAKFGYHAELVKDKLYTVTFTYDPITMSGTAPNQFIVDQFRKGGAKLTNVVVEPSSINWTYQEIASGSGTYCIKGDALLTKTTVKIQFKVNEDMKRVSLESSNA